MKDFLRKHKIALIQTSWIAVVWCFIKLDVLFLSNEPLRIKAIVATILFMPTIIYALKEFIIPGVLKVLSRFSGLVEPAVCLVLGSFGLWGAVTGWTREWHSWPFEIIVLFTVARLVVGVLAIILLLDAHFGIREWFRDRKAKSPQ